MVRLDPYGSPYGSKTPMVRRDGHYDEKIEAYKAAKKACKDELKKWNDANKDNIEKGS